MQKSCVINCANQNNFPLRTLYYLPRQYRVQSPNPQHFRPMCGNARQSWILDSQPWIPDSRYQIPLSVKSGFWIPIVSGIPDYLHLCCIPGSKVQDSGFYKQKFPGFRNSSHGYDVAMYTVVKEGQTFTIQKCDFNIEMFYFIVNRNRNACFKK